MINVMSLDGPAQKRLSNLHKLFDRDEMRLQTCAGVPRSWPENQRLSKCLDAAPPLSPQKISMLVVGTPQLHQSCPACQRPHLNSGRLILYQCAPIPASSDVLHRPADIFSQLASTFSEVEANLR